MPLQRSLVLDSAVAVTLGSALCYFFGGAYEQGTAVGLGLPAEFMARDLWQRVAAGADAVLALVISLPGSLVGDDGPRWNVAAVIATHAVVLAALLWFFRRSKLKLPLLLVWGISFVFLQIYVTAANSIQDWFKRSEKCLLWQGCPAARVPHKVTYVVAEGERKEVVGMFLSMNTKYLVMHSNGGLLIVPVESIKEIATAKPLPLR